MKTNKITTLCAAIAMMTAMAGCTGNDMKKEAEGLLDNAREQFGKGQYKEALATIDSLRKKCPEAIDERKAALRLYQEIELKRAQLNVENTDRALQKIESEYEQMKKTVEDLKSKGMATAEQLRSLTLTRVKRDSLKTVFDVECAKIKYINKRMKE